MRLSHIAWNLGGLSLPLVVAAFTVPSLLAKLGNERFGMLALAWGLIGYAGALDLGVGRALTQRVARLCGEKNISLIPDTLFTASRITLLTGLIAGVVITTIALIGGSSLIKTENISNTEITISILLLAIALPAQAMSATYKGLNEAFLNFKGISMLRACIGVINFAGPYAVSFFTFEMPWIISTLVLSRLLSLKLYKYLANRCLFVNSIAPTKGRYSNEIARNLFVFGGWVTVSSVISPLMVQADRFFIAAMISASAVSIYVIPYELITQSLIIVGAVSSVIFPTIGRMIKEKKIEWYEYFKNWLTRIIIIMVIACMSLGFALPWILEFWIGSSLNPESILVGQVLCVSVLFNSIGAMYYAAIHAHGRADITAKIHMIQFPMFILVLYILIHQWGIVGAAIAGAIRSLVDSLALMFFTNKNLKRIKNV